jgi:CelD/BcsL family acetyltransferase involved in cellulose biosynthesis
VTAHESTAIVEDLDSLAPYLSEWDALAVAGGKPFCAPGWMLSWWQGTRSERTRLKVILVHEGDRLVGVGPFFANMTFGLVELRLLSAGFSHRIGIVAEPGLEERIAPAMAAALAATHPASVVFEGIEGDDPWPDLLVANWPGRVRPRRRSDGELQAPVIHLDGDYEAWISRRERRFRKEARRHERRLEEHQVSRRVAADKQAIDALLTLHHQRWSGRGGSNVQDSARAVLLAAADSLPDERLLVASLDSPLGPVSAELIVRAGGTAVFWGGGFDPEWAQYGPGMQTMLFALGVLAKDGTATADLGGGAHPYKRRLADETTTLVWRTVFPLGWRYPLIRLRLAPKHVRLGLRKAARGLPPNWQRRLRSIRRGRTLRSG